MAAKKTIAYLTPFPVHDVSIPIEEALSELDDLKVLLTIVAEMAESAENKAVEPGNAAFDFAVPLNRIKRLAWIAMSTRERVYKAVDTSEDVVCSHIEQRVAA